VARPPDQGRPPARGHYAGLDDPDSQTAPAEVRAGLRRFLREPLLRGPVLDLGTGVGGNLAELAERFAVYGVDLSLSAARVAVVAAPVVVADGSRLPFRSAAFGTVVCTEVLEHVDSPTAVFAELARVLAPNGLAYVTTPNYANLAGLHKWIADRRSGGHDWNPWGAHEGGYEAFMTGRQLWGAAQTHFELAGVRGLDYGQALTGRFATLDRLAHTRACAAVLRRLLPRMDRATGRLAWHGMHIELTLRRTS
jgi:SAM-dependent methyltransferase